MVRNQRRPAGVTREHGGQHRGTSGRHVQPNAADAHDRLSVEKDVDGRRVRDAHGRVEMQPVGSELGIAAHVRRAFAVHHERRLGKSGLLVQLKDVRLMLSVRTGHWLHRVLNDGIGLSVEVHLEFVVIAVPRA